MTKEKRHLLEAASLVGESAREDGAWKVRLISEGQGSSGYYSRELLENHYEVFNDILSFKNHPVGWDGPETRDFTQIVGEILGETWVEDDERGMAAITGWYLPDPDYKGKIERYKNKLGVSIYAMGEGEFDEDTGNFHITSFEEDPYNSLDVVIAAGARGKFLESMRKAYESRDPSKASTASVEDKNETKGLTMEKDVEDRFNGIETLIQGLVASKAQESQTEADTAAAKAAADERVEAYDAALVAIDAVELLPAQKAALRESAKRGEDISSALEREKTIAAEALEAAKASIKDGAHFQESGRFGESAAAGDGYVLRGFGEVSK